MIHKFLNVRVLATLGLMFCALLAFSAPNAKSGEALFKGNCATCHNKNMKADMTGPALGGVEERWEGREEVLYNWIRNSGQVIASGDAYAVKLFNDWNKSVMQGFPNLTNENIDDILLYVNNVYTVGCAEAPCDTGTGDVAVNGTGGGSSNKWIYAVLFGILALLALVLTRITSNLNHLADVKAGTAAPRRTLTDVLTSKKIVTFVIFALVVLGGFTTINNAISFGRQQDYAPEQPIKFSHELHAGINKIDCQYCHDGARRSKHAVIPALNTCMNCHKAINAGPEHGKGEIAKIYAASGFDPISGTYYSEDISKDTILHNMETWLAEKYLDKDGNEITIKPKDAEAQFASAKQYVGTPIEWVRIHNLPDHAYFNHAQHVVAGGVECQTCHGPVEEMAVLKQYAPLSMGWCVNCHRQTEVKFAENPYYETFEKYHEDLKSGKMEKVTVEDIGGLECQKCHY